MFQTYFSIFLEKVWRKIYQPKTRGPRPGDNDVSIVWMDKVLHDKGELSKNCNISTLIVEDFSGHRGLSGAALHRVRITITDSITKKTEERTYALKMTPPYKSFRAKLNAISGGIPREAYMYNNFAETGLVSSFKTPKTYYAYGSFFTGNFALLMEDLGSLTTPVNLFFGNQIWGMKPLDNPRKPEEMLYDMFISAADLHLKYWNDKSLFNHSWLKCRDWYLGQGKASWILGIEAAKEHWRTAMADVASGKTKVKYSPKLISVMEKSLEAASWDKLQKTLQDENVPFTLTHGDFHAGNMLWKPQKEKSGSAPSKEGDLYLVDWSEFAVWEPTTDLGQTMISDVKREVWQAHDRMLVRAYWEHLTRNGVDGKKYTWEQCWKSYCTGCVERWIWLMALLSSMGLPDNAVQYFHDQVINFIEDHGDYEVYTLKPIVTFVAMLK